MSSRKLYHPCALSGISVKGFFTIVCTRNTLCLHHLANNNRHHGCSVVLLVYASFSLWCVKIVLYYPSVVQATNHSSVFFLNPASVLLLLLRSFVYLS